MKVGPERLWYENGVKELGYFGGREGSKET